MGLINQVMAGVTAESVKPGVRATTSATDQTPNSFAQTLNQQISQPAFANADKSNPQTKSAKMPMVNSDGAQSGKVDNTAKKSADGSADKSKVQSSNPDETASGKSEDVQQKESNGLVASEANDSVEEDVVSMQSALDATALMVNLPLSPWMQSMMDMRQSLNLSQSSHLAADLSGELVGAQLDTNMAKTLPELNPIADGLSLAETSSGLGKPALAAEAQEFSLQLATAGNKSDLLTGLTADLSAGALKEALTLAESKKSSQAEVQVEMSTLMAANSNQTTSLATSPLAEAQTLLPTVISTPFANQERWQSAVNQHVVNMAGNGDEIASLTLSPPDLGPVQVVLKVDNQSVDTTFISDNPLVRQALEDGMQDLRDRMQSQGLQLGQAFIGNGQQAEQHFNSQQQSRVDPHSRADASSEESTPIESSLPKLMHIGVVDTFV